MYTNITVVRIILQEIFNTEPKVICLVNRGKVIFNERHGACVGGLALSWAAVPVIV